MKYDESLKQVRDYIISFYTNRMDARLLYHNHVHTWELVDTAGKIASQYGLDDRSRFIVLASAWFYDTGYFSDGTSAYEAKSAEQAENYLKTVVADDSIAGEVKNCIIAAAMPQHPKNLPEEIVCDAVTYYMGTKDFPEKNRLLRREAEALSGKEIAGTEWRKESISLMESHRYFTDYCQSHLNKIKIENINRLKRKQEKQQNENRSGSTVAPVMKVESNMGSAGATAKGGQQLSVVPGLLDKREGEGKKKNSRPQRGVETLFRVSSTNHQRLSAMADNKAHIMISVNSIIISAILALLIRNLEAVPYLLFPTILLLFVNVVAIIFSVLATRPKLPNGFFTKEQVEQKDVDLGFFGNYYKMDFKSYDAGMKQLMNDGDFLYGSFTRNLYGQAKVLGRKYRLLQISYDVFMFGIVAAILAFVISLLVNI